MEVAQSDSAKIDITPDTTRLDQALSDNTSALRLAQNLGADFILIPSLTTYGTERKTYTGNGISTVNITHTLRVSYKIVEAGAGGAIKGDMVTASKTIRQSGNLQVDSSDVINELLDDAAGQLADCAGAELPGRCPPRSPRTNRSISHIACSMTDISGSSRLLVPDRAGDGGQARGEDQRPHRRAAAGCDGGTGRHRHRFGARHIPGVSGLAQNAAVPRRFQ